MLSLQRRAHGAGAGIVATQSCVELRTVSGPREQREQRTRLLGRKAGLREEAAADGAGPGRGGGSGRELETRGPVLQR